MTIRGWILWFFPPPRRPIGLRTVLPLIIFMTLFLGGALLATLAGWVVFAAPWAFLLAVLLPWVWWMHMGGFGGLSGGRALVALLVRLALVGTFIILFAGPRSVRKNDHLSIVFAVDMSASIAPDSLNAAMSFVTAAATKGKPERDEAGLVVFGRDAAVELQPGTSFPFEQFNLQVDRDATNIEKGLSLAAAMLPQDTQGRIVLISDGDENEGNTRSVLDELKSRGIAVDVLPVNYDYKNEVWLERVELPRFIKIGESYEAAIILSSLAAGEGELALRENGNVIFRKKVSYNAGKNRYTVPIYLREPGYYEYTATIGPPEGVRREDWPDGTDRNNKAISYLYVQGEDRVMVVTDPGGNRRDYEDLIRALTESKHVVDVRTAFEFPAEPLELLPYGCIIFANVPADLLGATQMAALHDAVYDQGTGFLMVGGENSFGPGGYRHTPVEDILPVSMDVSQKKVLPKGALVVILHTCEFADGNTWAKEITKKAIKTLGAQDLCGALDYDSNGGDSWIFPLTPASEFPRLSTRINNAMPNDMPSFANLMSMALGALQASDASTKHVIIISDGDPSPPSEMLIKDYIRAKVTVSTVTIHPHAGSPAMMENIAGATGGRHYFPQDANLLPAIFIKEAKTLRRTMIQNKPFHPVAGDPSEIFKGIPHVPDLGGYVLTSAKPRANTLLRSPENEEVEPVLATWRFGTGKTAAFTSDLSTNWGAKWVNWDRFVPFVKQLMTDISRVHEPGNLRIQTYPASNQGIVVVEDYAPDSSFLEVRAQVSGPRDMHETITLKQTAPRRYEGRFPLSGEGRYQVTGIGAGPGSASDAEGASGGGGARTERVRGGFVVPYSEEYLRFRYDPILLNDIVQRTNGRMLNDKVTGKELFDVPREQRRSSQPIFDWFLLLLACLVPLDVGVRRVQLDWGVIRGWMGVGRAAQASQGTFAALRTRKASVQNVLKGKDRPPGAPPPPVTRDDDLLAAAKKAAEAGSPGTPGTPGKPTAPAAGGAPAKPEAPTGTTSRLLDLKKKRQQGDQK